MSKQRVRLSPSQWSEVHWITLLMSELLAVNEGGVFRVENREQMNTLGDLAHAGLMSLESNAGPWPWADSYVRVHLTDRGWRWAWFLRRWKAEGKRLQDAASEHVTRTDPKSVNAMARSLVGGDTHLAAAMYSAGVNAVSEETYAELLRHADPPVQACVECGEWVIVNEEHDDLCPSCFKTLQELDDEPGVFQYDDYILEAMDMEGETY